MPARLSSRPGRPRLPPELLRLFSTEDAGRAGIRLLCCADAIAAVWSEVLGKTIAYGGDDLAAFEAKTRAHVPPSMAYDLAPMFDAWQKIGVLPMPGAADHLVAMLGRPLKTYRTFAHETAEQWRSA